MYTTVEERLAKLFEYQYTPSALHMTSHYIDMDLVKGHNYDDQSKEIKVESTIHNMIVE